MNFDALVKYIKAQGCKVTVYRKKNKVNGSMGEFGEDPRPHINIAVQGHSKALIASTLLHEYAHFLQWKEGFSRYLDKICLAYTIQYDWLHGNIELTDYERQIARNAMLSIEHDAESRAYNLGVELEVEHFDPIFHLQETQNYMASIKWSWKNRKEWAKRTPHSLWPSEKMGFNKLFAPLTDTENKILKDIRIAATPYSRRS
jgi:hypothetical protein